jgi:hypothetical protein
MSGSPHKRPSELHTTNPHLRRCAICGSTKDLQEHHLGGRKHAAYFTLSLCRSHHEAVTIAIARAKVNMQPTAVAAERSRRARQAAYVFLWFLEEATQTDQENEANSSRS